MLWLLLALLSTSCGQRTEEPITHETSVDAPAEEVSVDVAVPDVREAEPIDAAPFVPTEVDAELVFAGPSRVTTPATWNANLPKLAGDDRFLYAVHTHAAEAVDARFAVVVRRKREGGVWTEVARVTHSHQPPGIVMDRSKQLHMVFDCLRPATTDVTCFQGGAGTGGLGSRFYHLIFSARDAEGALRFDTYANHGEWTAHSNGYYGIGTTSGGDTIWSLANESWGRVVQYRTESGMGGTFPTLTRPDTYLLYPIVASSGKQLLFYAGEFDPKGGTNAGYPASTGYRGDLVSLTEAFRRTPSIAVKPGEVGSFPSDVAYDAAGVAFVLAYRLAGGGVCSELLRFDDGLAATPKVFAMGCLETYAKLQIARDGTLYVVASSSGKNLRLGTSRDRGVTFTFAEVPIVGLPANGDTRFFGATPIKPYSSPLIYDPDRFVFFFAGTDEKGGAMHSYLGSLRLAR